MWRNRKARFTIVIALLIGANLTLWVLHQASGDPDFLGFLILVDVATVLMFAVIGILAAWCLAFRPEALVRSIQRGIARRSANEIASETIPEVGRAAIAAIETEVCAMLGSRPEALGECLRAVKETQEGQSRTASGDSKGALELFQAAHARFEAIPEARLLLGLTKGDLAAVYGNLGDFDRAIGSAEDCLAIVAGVERLSSSEAMVRLTLATLLGLLGKRDQSESEFRIAETMLRGLPDTARSLQTLQSNRNQVLGLATKPNAYRLGRSFATIIVWAAIVLAAIILFVMTRSS